MARMDASEIERQSNARIVAVQALYLMELTGLKADKVIADFLAGDMPVESGTQIAGGYDHDFFSSIVHSVVEKRKTIDALISANLDAKWSLDRLEKTLRALLRAAVAEILGGDIDGPLLINDYLNVAHGFFSGKEPGLPPWAPIHMPIC
ncbi:MAG: transcription antitermination protein NusB [Proteobacteria bacterium]|nr:transcription antitermination protein NusB [Pseudomonadota bacterium]